MMKSPPAHWLLCLLLIQPLSTNAAPDARELADLFLPPEIDRPKLSPNGDYVGFRMRQGDQYSVGLYDFAAGRLESSGGNSKVKPLDFWWKTPRRLLIKTSNYKLNALGYTAFDVDGKNPEDVWRLVKQPGSLFDAQPGDPRHILMFNGEEIMQVDLDSGYAKKVDSIPAWVQAWVVDGDGRAHAAYRHDSRFGTLKLWWRSNIASEWHSIEYQAADKKFVPEGVDFDGSHLWGWQWTTNEQPRLARFDPQTNHFETIPLTPHQEPTGLLLLGRTRQPVAAVYTQGPAVSLIALNQSQQPAISRLQEHFAGFFPIIVDTMRDGKTWLVWVGNSRLPGAYFLFDSVTATGSFLALSHSSALSEERLTAADYITFPRRGGGTLSGMLWRPRNVARPPLVVYCPRRLPETPALNTYKADVQALVAQGFAVLQANVRGTRGFDQGEQDTAQGEWGLYVQEDLEDAVDYLVAHQAVDPQHINLFGSYFAGVLAIDIATRSSRFAAVATLNVPAKVNRQDLFNYTNDSGLMAMTDRLGGWFASAQMAHDLSPVLQAPHIKIPSLYLHNEDSIKGRVNEEGRDVQAAAKKAPGPTQTGLAYSWSDKPKPPTKLAQESAEIWLQIGRFFNHAPALLKK